MNEQLGHIATSSPFSTSSLVMEKSPQGNAMALQSSQPVRQGCLKAAHEAKRVSRKLSSWSLAFSLTHTLIFHSRVSLVYGSTCSLLVLSYYKCLLRLNSDIAKAFCQCSNSPRTSLSKTMGLKFSKNVAIQ